MNLFLEKLIHMHNTSLPKLKLASFARGAPFLYFITPVNLVDLDGDEVSKL